ncbi:unnamed protein product [Rhizophagus irregularis]|uniref:Uncharacterized protein n=1 Tax=Rhizophagus irregularis TaxID=588596 RepID=A0A2N1P4D6_9GLOM|nr:hypothetical protein RhiirC2_767525 [Rhizophagus irregularis]CAB5369001.1 unnamed protein product [Rhizophagus irregularis]
MSSIYPVNNETSQKTAETTSTSPSHTSSIVENVHEKISSKSHDQNAQLPSTSTADTIDNMDIEFTNDNDTTQPTDRSTSKNVNRPPIEEIPLIDVFSASHMTAQTSFEGFIPRDSFPPKFTDKEILQNLNNIFVKDKDVIKVRSLKKMTFKFFMISVTSKDKLSQLINTLPPELKNIKIYEYTQANLNTLTEQKLKNQDDIIIKILDIGIKKPPKNP